MNAHQLDRVSGGCVCGSEWIYNYAECASTPAWDTYYECGKGHAHCSRH
jgi:hypothetical protein